MPGTIRISQFCAVLLLLSFASCQSPTPNTPARPEPASAVAPASSQPVPTVAPPSSQPAMSQEAAKNEADSHHVDPGVYKFKARVENIKPIETNLQHKMVDGAGTVRGERCVFTGIDLNWKIVVEIQEVYDPLSFLKPGEPLTFAVRSATDVFGKSNEDAAGKVFDFSLTITESRDGRLHYGPLTTPGGAFAKEGGFEPQK